MDAQGTTIDAVELATVRERAQSSKIPETTDGWIVGLALSESGRLYWAGG
jgi:hypothetical protein